ncbi:MAG: FeoB-associated Cys-rich membrane protein [Coriobacteriales bacterium]|jgi:hypothetical protein
MVATIVIAGLIAVAFVAIIVSQIRKHKKGGSSCSCGCDCCSENCSTMEIKVSKDDLKKIAQQ